MNGFGEVIKRVKLENEGVCGRFLEFVGVFEGERLIIFYREVQLRWCIELDGCLRDF